MERAEEPSTTGCVASLLSAAVLFVLFLSAFDGVITGFRADNACPTSGVASKSIRWSFSDLVYYKVRCVNGNYHRVN